MAADQGLQIEALSGHALVAALPDVAALRISVFRDWPYLYDGTIDYERRYLAELAQADAALIVVARDCGRIVGAATAAPLAGHTPQFARLFRDHDLDPARTFYCGESVLLSQYRGRGLGHAFFDRREAHARSVVGPNGGYTHIAFCGVVRDPADPRMPADYRPLDPFWRRRGYSPVEGLVGSYSWKEIGSDEETAKPMQFWMKTL